MKRITIVWQAIACLSFFHMSEATAAEHWQVCDSCSVAARQSLATQLPPNQFGTTLVNVLDRDRREKSSFRVSVFYDFEFRQFFRFAVSVPTSVQSGSQFAAWLDFDATVVSLGEQAVDTNVASAAAWIANPATASQQLLAEVRQGGLQDLLHAMGNLAPLALVSDISILARFSDNSTGQVRVFVDDQTGSLSAIQSLSRAHSPSGRILPDSLADLIRLDQIGDNTDTEYLGGHIVRAWENARWLREARVRLQEYNVYCVSGAPGAINCYSVGVG